MTPINCHGCGATFDRTHGRQKYCGDACRPDYDHRKVSVPCDACGTLCEKEPSQLRKYSNTFCSYLCRDYTKHGPLSSELPKDHWAIAWGATCEWKPPTKARTVFIAGACGECGRGYVQMAGSTPSLWCSRLCARRVERRRRRAREHDAPGEFRYTDIVRQYHRQGGRCAYCHQPCIGLPEPEHVVPLSRGGRNDMTNLVAACRSCNTDKSDMTLKEWHADRLRRGLAPRPAELHGSAYVSLMPTLNVPSGVAHRHRAAA